MADADTAWVMYAADYDTGRQHSRIIPNSVRILRVSTREFSSGELQAERERTGLDNRLHTIQIEVPPEVGSENLAAYAERYISLEPGFDFWDDVIGDDIVVAGIVYNGDLDAPDGEDGVRPLTEAEQAAREATIGLREAEQTAREAQRRRQAIDYATTSAAQQPIRQDASVANDAIDRFLQYQGSGMDVAEARREAVVDVAWDHAVTAQASEPAGAYAPGFVSALPAIGGFRVAEDAIEQFVSLQRSGLEPAAARDLAVKRTGTPEPERRSAHNPEVERELDRALADAPDDVRDAYWRSRDLTRLDPQHDQSGQAGDDRAVGPYSGQGPAPSLVAGLRQRAADLRAELDSNPSETPSTSYDRGVIGHREGEPVFGADVTDAGPSDGADVGL